VRAGPAPPGRKRATMRTSAAFLLAVLAACRAGGAPPSTGTGDGGPSPAAEAAPPSACGDPAPTPDPACAGVPLCGEAERVRVACGLGEALSARYVFWGEKARLLAVAGGARDFDPREQLEGCAAAERAIPREPDPLRFLDRLRACIAAFEDGHLFMALPRALPQASLGLRLRRAADGRVWVAYLDPGLSRWLGETPGGEGRLQVGDEVVAVDGRPVGEAIAALARLVPGSSAAARAERAVDALGRRDFAYPEQPEAALTVEGGQGGDRREVRLPWLVAPGAERDPLLGPWLRRVGVAASDRIDWRAESRGAWLREPGAAPGLLRGDPAVGPEDAARLTAYRGDSGGLAARLGSMGADGGSPACYAQLLTLHTERLEAFGRARPLPDVLREFVRGCDERHLDLVLDLRQNEGGYLSHSSALAALLEPAGARAPGGALLLRATAQNERVYRERAPMLGGAGPRGAGGVATEPEQILSAIRDARRAGEEFTPAFLEPSLAADGGFRGRVVVLTSPGCMSACDRLAALLQRGGRAVLVGEPTEGAGASQQETREQSARWVDPGGLVGVSIPNAAMGVQATAEAGAGRADARRFFAELAFENRPVRPDLPYATTRDDLVGGNRGWLAAARSALARAPAPPPR
jgi:hypothetical protein